MRAIGLDVGDGCRLAPEGMVDEIFGIDAELVVKQVFVERRGLIFAIKGRVIFGW